jgi:hypothetical protein
MIVIGVDPHKQTHTAAAVDGRTSELLGELTVRGNEEGHARLLEWARELGGERRFALEDCRQVSCRLERFLIGRGEGVVRVPAKLMARSRRSQRRRGKSDAIDALAVARAAIREPDLPAAQQRGRERLVVRCNDCVRTESPPDVGEAHAETLEGHSARLHRTSRCSTGPTRASATSRTPWTANRPGRLPRALVPWPRTRPCRSPRRGNRGSASERAHATSTTTAPAGTGR